MTEVRRFHKKPIIIEALRWEAVRKFSREMENRLKANDHKGGWESCDEKWLLRRARQETHELQRALSAKNPRRIIEECADAANFLMMIADNWAALEETP